MKPPKNRTKLLRVACGICKATQDSLHAQCTQCGNPLYSNMSPEELAEAGGLVTAIEERLQAIELGEKTKGNPYQPYDEVNEKLRSLRGYHYLPGMPEYLAAARTVMLPYKVRMMENTTKANIVFCFLLVLFALVPIMLHWPPVVKTLMLLPALVWLALTLRAWSSLRKARAEMNA